MSSTDALVYELSMETEGSKEPFVRQDWLSILDNQNGQYNSFQSVIDTSQLSNSDKWMNYREGFLSVPLLITATGSSFCFQPGTTGSAADGAIGLKNWFGSIVHSLSVDLGGTTIIQQTPFINFVNCFKLMTSLSWQDVASIGSTIGFYPDTSDSFTYSLDANEFGQMYANNNTTSVQLLSTPLSPSENAENNPTCPPVYTYAPFNSGTFGGPNVGFIKRNKWLAFDLNGVLSTPSSAPAIPNTDGLSPALPGGFTTTTTSPFGALVPGTLLSGPSNYVATYGTLITQNSLNLLWRSYVTSVNGQQFTQQGSGATVSIYQNVAMVSIYLKHLHTFFHRLPLCKGVFLRFTLNLNSNANVTFDTCVPPPGNGLPNAQMIVSQSSVPSGGIMPLMIASAAQVQSFTPTMSPQVVSSLYNSLKGNTVTVQAVTELPPEGTELYGAGFSLAVYNTPALNFVNPLLVSSGIVSNNTAGALGQIWSSLILQYNFAVPLSAGSTFVIDISTLLIQNQTGAAPFIYGEVFTVLDSGYNPIGFATIAPTTGSNGLPTNGANFWSSNTVNCTVLCSVTTNTSLVYLALTSYIHTAGGAAILMGGFTLGGASGNVPLTGPGQISLTFGDGQATEQTGNSGDLILSQELVKTSANILGQNKGLGAFFGNGGGYNTFYNNVITSLEYANGSYTRPTINGTVIQPFNVNLSVGQRCLAPSNLTGSNVVIPNGQLGTGIQLFLPAYTMSPIFETAYLTNPIKQIKYIDYYYYQIPQQNANFTYLVTNGIASMRECWIFPLRAPSQSSTTQSLNGPYLPSVAQYLNPFDSCGGGTVCPLSNMTQFNVLLSGQNMSYSMIKYSFEAFQEQFYGRSGALNGGLTDGLTSGLISQYDWQTSMGVYYMDLSRMLAAEDNVPKSLQIQGINLSQFPVEYIVFLGFEVSIAVDVLTGARV